MKGTIIEAATVRLYRFLINAKGATKPGALRAVAIAALEDLQVILKDDDRLIGEDEIPVKYPFKPEFVTDKRYAGEGPVHYRIGHHLKGRVIYKVSDFEKWIENHRVGKPHVAQITGKR